MTQIFIENNQVDVTATIPALLTLSIDDVKDFAARTTTFSKTIVLPGTARNNKVFGHLFDVRNANPYNELLPNVGINFNAAKSARCIILSDNIQTFKGSLRLLQIIIDKGSVEYEVAVFGELYGLVTAIGRGRLEDLDFSAYDHTYSYANITGSWSNANAGAGYYYPLIDYGNYSVNKDHWAVGTFRPALFAREYLSKIFAAAGYTYDCTLFDTDRFKRLVVPYAQKRLVSNRSQALRAQVTTPLIINLFADTQPMVFDTQSLGDFTEATGVFTWTNASTRTFSLVFSMEVEFTETITTDFSFYFEKNGVKITGTEQQIFADGIGAIFNYTASFDVTLAQTNTIAIIFESPSLPSFAFNVNIADFVLNSATPLLVPVSIGDDVTVNDTMPKNILQKDFLSSIVKLFNLYIYEDVTKDNHVIIAPYVDFYPGTSADWTHKVDRSKPMKLTPMASLNARFYDFKFKNDADYYNDLYQKRYNEGYGQYIYDSAFDFEDDRQTVELVFSPTPLVGYAGEDKVMSTILKIENNIETQTDSNIRILQAANVTGVTSWNIVGGTSGLTSYGYAGHYNDPDAPSNDIQFGVPRELFFTLISGDVSVQQFNVYWSEYMAEITDKDSRLLTVHVKLNVTDILNLDFGTLIWIDGALWRLNKIEDYNISEPDLCVVSFLKVIEKDY